MSKSLSHVKAAVLGYPISHSLSPVIHGYWFSAHHIDGHYQAIEVEPDNLGQTIQKLCDEGYAGCNVTLPHKVACMEHLDEVTSFALRVGAVNTVWFTEEGKKIGTNTDVAGFIDNITYQQPDWNFTGNNVCVLGAGGAARAVCVGLLDEGVERIVLTNRTRAKAELLVELDDTRIEVVDWEDKESCFSDMDMVVNTTSLGMKGQAALVCDCSGLPDHALVVDIVYHPLKTDLLQQAETHGLLIVTGLGMLLHQAVPAFEIWTGVRPVVDLALEDLVIGAMT